MAGCRHREKLEWQAIDPGKSYGSRLYTQGRDRMAGSRAREEIQRIKCLPVVFLQITYTASIIST